MTLRIFSRERVGVVRYPQVELGSNGPGISLVGKADATDRIVSPKIHVLKP